ncbi:DUF5671 domain-containing protein [Paracoccus tegillarcae]|uniref:DUF5671 domain-containing protein n=1 Tax=Paracoccus tegillarcae TaxID=1529068 RepID=A0A2K9EX71_9RHOB|nr:DUF5671 domain-containing protein [Paracoccus tegillarcae]AUH35566.1 hypothetical protein CUV01_18165 [Paracoccus tegillarcae]
MKSDDLLSEFVREALIAGQSQDQIAQALADAGWSQTEIRAASEGWTVQAGLPPVPRPRAYVSASEALLYGLLFLSLGMIAWHTVIIGFAVIDRLLPDPLDPAGSGRWLRWSVSALVAFLPLFLLLNRRVNRAGRDDPARQRSLVRKWVASITLLLASLALLGDLVAVVYAFLNGDMTAQFLAKALLVAIMAGLIFGYYKDEMDG